MNNREVALDFVRHFCAGDLQGLEALLADHFKFSGPLHQFDTREGYLKALRDEPPEPGEYRIDSVTDDGHEVAVFYDYIKSDRRLPVAQLFRLVDGKIAEIQLLFDGRGFS